MKDKYRLICKQYCYKVICIFINLHNSFRKMVMIIMKELDPCGVTLRKSRRLIGRQYFSKVLIPSYLLCLQLLLLGAQLYVAS